MRHRIRRRRKVEQRSGVKQEAPQVQARLEVGQPGDQYEKQADAVADRVVMMPNQQHGLQMKPALDAPEISMKCAACEKEDKMQMKSKEDEEKVRMKSKEEEEKVQMKSEEEEKIQKKSKEEEKVQKKSDEEEKVQTKSWVQREPNGKTYATAGFSTKLETTKGKGSRLPESVNQEFSSKIGADFSDVKVHTGGDAVQLNEDVGAHAFTHGKDIYFNENKYNTATHEGKHLLAHELTHVVQQGSAGTVQRAMGDGHDLSAPRFMGITQLEAAYDNEQYVQTSSRGEHVAALQGALMDIGYDLPQFGADGIFGNETKSTVETFQRDFGLGVDGIVGPNTMGVLDNIFTVEDTAEEIPEGDEEQIVHDGDAEQGATFPASDRSLNEIAMANGDNSNGVIQTDLKSPPDKIAKPPHITRIDIDLAGQKLKITWSDKHDSGPYTISSGKGCPNTKNEPCKGAKASDQDTYCTPAGTFTVEGLGGEDYKNSDDDAMSWYVAFLSRRGIGIHNSQAVTGTPKSHGCVRVAESVAKMIHNNVINTTSIVVSGEAPAAKWTLNKKKTKKGYKGCPLPPEKKQKSKPKAKSKKKTPGKKKK